MALALGVGVGGNVFVGATHIKVVKIHDEEEFIIALHKEDLSGKTFKITAEKAVEIAPEVFVSAGRGMISKGKMARLVIDAPKSMDIRRS